MCEIAHTQAGQRNTLWTLWRNQLYWMKWLGWSELRRCGSKPPGTRRSVFFSAAGPN